jgi:hypothetical protein
VLRSLSGFDSNHVYAVGTAGVTPVGYVSFFDGAAWTGTEVPGIGDLHGVWVASPSSVLAAGSEGRIARFDGNNWVVEQTGLKTVLFDVWGTSQQDVYAVSRNGGIVHFDGSSWCRFRTNSEYDVTGVHGALSGSILFVGDGGSILGLSEGTRLFGQPGASLPSEQIGGGATRD